MQERHLLLHKGDGAQPIGDAQADVRGDLHAGDSEGALDDGHARGDEKGPPRERAPLAQRLQQLLQLRADGVALAPARSDM